MRSTLQPGRPVARQAATVLEDTPIHVVTADAISSKHTEQGTPLRLTVSENVMIGDAIVIPCGATVRGELIRSKKSGRLTGSPELSVEQMENLLVMLHGKPDDNAHRLFCPSRPVPQPVARPAAAARPGRLSRCGLLIRTLENEHSISCSAVKDRSNKSDSLRIYNDGLRNACRKAIVAISCSGIAGYFPCGL